MPNGANYNFVDNTTRLKTRDYWTTL